MAMAEGESSARVGEEGRKKKKEEGRKKKEEEEEEEERRKKKEEEAPTRRCGYGFMIWNGKLVDAFTLGRLCCCSEKTTVDFVGVLKKTVDFVCSDIKLQILCVF
jgi:hypothetical protein